MYDYYVDITSTSHVYTDNTASSFRVAVNIPYAEECSLEEIQLAETDIKALYIRSNFIKPQFINETRRPVLRVIYSPREHNQLSSQYRQVERNSTSVLEFRIEDSNQQLIKFEKDSITRLTLHFRHGVRT